MFWGPPHPLTRVQVWGLPRVLPLPSNRLVLQAPQGAVSGRHRRSLLTTMLRQGTNLWLVLSKSPEDISKSPDTVSVPLSPFAPCTRDILGHRGLRIAPECLGPPRPYHPCPRKMDGNAGTFWTCTLWPWFSEPPCWVHLNWLPYIHISLHSQPTSSFEVQPGQQLLSSQDPLASASLVRRSTPSKSLSYT